MREVLRVARREIAAFFSSPVAYLFLGAFLAVTLFVFFWVETFFARNIADVAPLFEWMPVLLIFLVAAITMRMWSEERRAGTLEVLMTAPVSSLQLVLGKFLACVALVIVALILTLSLPVMVAFIGPLDWGPVIGGYLATILLAAAYAAIGLYISARTDNQIVSLIGTVLVGAVFYLIGSDVLTGLFSRDVADILTLLGTGSRFESITRGVLDLRDLYYYVSLVGIFLTLNVYSLERLRWAHGAGKSGSRRNWRVAALLLVANFIAVNLWLAPIHQARADITEGNIYSISSTTKTYLSALEEPLIIRGYFSDKTHPLLAPLVPRVKNLLRSYAAVGGDKVHLQFVQPLDNPERAKEAARQYGIKPVPFRTRTKYGTSVVNSYFNVLIKYGDEYVTLNFRDLVSIKRSGVGDINVHLKNPEYEITRAIRKVVYAYRGSGDVFASLDEPVMFHGYISPPKKLPKRMARLRADLEAVLAQLKAASGGSFHYAIRNPMAGNGALADKIFRKYGFRPMVASLFSGKQFYFYMVLTQDGQSVVVPLPRSLDKSGLKQAIKEALERFAGGTLRTIALYTPSGGSSRFGMGGASYSVLVDMLKANAIVKKTNLKSGNLPAGSDILLVVAPWELSNKQVFTIDQFLMRGGTVVIAASTFDISKGPGGLTASKRETGLEDWLAAKGITLGEAMVMDPQNTPFPLPVRRDIGGFTIRQVYSVSYPYFPAIFSGGMTGKTPITSGINQLTMTWAAPIRTNEKKLGKLEATPLLYSSPGSWLSASTDIIPELTRTGVAGFEAHGQRKPRLLGVVLEGSFQSYFKNRPNPMLASGKDDGTGKQSQEQSRKKSAQQPDQSSDKGGDGSSESGGKPETIVSNVIAHSPPSARLVIYSSASFVGNLAMRLVGSGMRTIYRAPVHLMQNTVDWALQDAGLLALRGDTYFSRVLKPLSPTAQVFWEYVNYAYALFGLLVLFGVNRGMRRRTQRRYRDMLNDTSDDTSKHGSHE